MPRAKPTPAALGDLEPGQYADFFALLSERTKGTTGEGKPYYRCRFRDARRAAVFMVWADGGYFEECEASWRVGQIYKLRAVYAEHEKYGPQLDVKAIREAADADRADGFDPLAFVERSRFDPDELLAQIHALVETNVADEPLRTLVLLVLDRHADALRRAPGSKDRYHPFAGGWAEHTLSVTVSCLFLVELYRTHYPDLKPSLNRDLLIAGAVLHDVGRCVEFANDATAERTVPGHLLGHIVLGRDLVRDAARDVPDLRPDLLLMLEHLIVSHLAIPEWGSPKLPLIPESLILHHADDLDAKLEMYARCLTRDTAEGPFTDRDWSLGRQLFKGREV
ncbi:MAG: HD domain-containing protein [Gemmataceae bacterium]